MNNFKEIYDKDKSTWKTPPPSINKNVFQPPTFSSTHYIYQRNKKLRMQANGQLSKHSYIIHHIQCDHNCNYIPFLKNKFNVYESRPNKMSPKPSKFIGVERRAGDLDYIDEMDEFKEIKAFKSNYESVTD